MFDRIQLANNVDTDLTPHDVASNLGLHSLPMILYGFPGKNSFISTSRPYSSKIVSAMDFHMHVFRFRQCVEIKEVNYRCFNSYSMRLPQLSVLIITS